MSCSSVNDIQWLALAIVSFIWNAFYIFVLMLFFTYYNGSLFKIYSYQNFLKNFILCIPKSLLKKSIFWEFFKFSSKFKYLKFNFGYIKYLLYQILLIVIKGRISFSVFLLMDQLIKCFKYNLLFGPKGNKRAVLQ